MSNRALHEFERVEWRVLGALRPVDGTTGIVVRGALEVSAAGARIVRNRSGLYVIHEWARLASHAAAFDAPPAQPAAGSERLDIALRDPSGRYLPRLASIALPRDPQAAGADSLFAAVDVPLYPSAIAGLGTNWTELRAHISATADGAALGGALLRVVAGGLVLARGMSDWRGEALVPVVGVPVTTWSEDDNAVVVSSIAATVEVHFDPALGSRTPSAEVRAGRQPAVLRLVDPADIEARRAALPTTQQNVSLAARGALNLNLGLDLP